MTNADRLDTGYGPDTDPALVDITETIPSGSYDVFKWRLLTDPRASAAWHWCKVGECEVHGPFSAADAADRNARATLGLPV